MNLTRFGLLGAPESFIGLAKSIEPFILGAYRKAGPTWFKLSKQGP